VLSLSMFLEKPSGNTFLKQFQAANLHPMAEHCWKSPYKTADEWFETARNLSERLQAICQNIHTVS
jgi:hypothetical protein